MLSESGLRRRNIPKRGTKSQPCDLTLDHNDEYRKFSWVDPVFFELADLEIQSLTARMNEAKGRCAGAHKSVSLGCTTNQRLQNPFNHIVDPTMI